MATGTTSYNNWQFNNYHVQQELTGGQFINAESTLIAAGPPSLTHATGAEVTGSTSTANTIYPIGLLETFGIQQSRQLQRIFEIGSARSYFIPGRTIGSVNLGRTFYHGPNLLKVLYAAYYGSTPVSGAITGFEGVSSIRYASKRSPGSGDFLIDLASDLFAQPIGLATYFKDAYSSTYGAFYLEQTYIQGHQLTVSSGSVLVMEGASLQYDVLAPIGLNDPNNMVSVAFP